METQSIELKNSIANQKAIVRNNYKGKIVKRITPEGLEKLCPVCDEWWPQTGEFFSYLNTRNYYHNECRACRSEKEALRRMRKRMDDELSGICIEKIKDDCAIRS